MLKHLQPWLPLSNLDANLFEVPWFDYFYGSGFLIVNELSGVEPKHTAFVLNPLEDCGHFIRRWSGQQEILTEIPRVFFHTVA
jgi:hypothetical protein